MSALDYHEWTVEVASIATHRRIDFGKFNGVSKSALKAYTEGRSPKEFLSELLDKSKESVGE